MSMSFRFKDSVHKESVLFLSSDELTVIKTGEIYYLTIKFWQIIDKCNDFAADYKKKGNYPKFVSVRSVKTHTVQLFKYSNTDTQGTNYRTANVTKYTDTVFLRIEE